MMLKAHELTRLAGRRTLLDGVSLDVRAGEFLAVVGPNGSGKSSLLSILSGLRTPDRGHVCIEGAPLASLSRRQAAQRIALVQQQAETEQHMTAWDAVALGRTPHLSLLRPFGPADAKAVDAALEVVDMGAMRARQWQTLSGGERQRLHVARALAQEPDIIILDEPTNHLDIQHQLELLALMRRLPMTIVAALHDLNHAMTFADRVAVLQQGRLEGLGAPADVLTARRIAKVFKVEARLIPDGAARPLIAFGVSAPAAG